MYIILEGLEKKDVASCALVCRDWAAIVHEVMWRGRSDSGVGIRPILGLLPEYYEESRNARFRVAPNPASWDRFNEPEYAGRISVLNLNIQNLRCTIGFLAVMSDSIKSPMHLPALNELHVTVCQDPVEFRIAMAFFSANVTHFVANIERGYPSATGHFSNQLDPHTSTVPTASPLDAFFDTVHQRMPHIRVLTVNVRDSEAMVDAFDPFVDMLCGLKELITLSLPPYMLGLSLVTALSTHQQLRNIVVIRQDPTRRTVMDSDDSYGIVTQPIFGPDELSTRLAELAVVVPVDSFIPFFSHQFDPHNLTQLDLTFTGEIAVSDSLRTALSLIADRCGSLENLTVSLLQSCDNPWRLDYAALEPLRKCERLVSLVFTTRFTTDLDNNEFEELVSHWPMLKRLVFDGSDVVPVSPDERSSLCLGTVMELLRKYCPFLLQLRLHLSMVLQRYWFMDRTIFRRIDNLTSVTFVIGSPTTTPVSQIAIYLAWILPPKCKLSYFPAIHDMSPQVRLVEWKARRKVLVAFCQKLTRIVARFNCGPLQTSHIDPLSIIERHLSSTHLL
ncbi:hypothetical protein PHLCEN_2v2971 [Hermanssonia centrifuga]|uniref:F-box domain-containing protein n=1 Tax=Hermanssonia centrifuga TaxID=98765 RepID=A0A2R6REP7_9APHY|nr:hypothetical protein PHLCEN_2v2971 [Hermanssonia centrifuga]